MKLPAKKSLGQNFLSDRRYLALILEAAELTATDAVLEIGPGQGVLTEALAARVGCLVAVELDDRLITPLRQRFASQPHVHIVHADILEQAPEKVLASACLPEGEIGDWRLGDSAIRRFGAGEAIAQSPNLQSLISNPPISYKVVANLPYYITSAALRHLLEATPPPSLAVLMVQWEVAQRICAAPGDLSLLAVSVQFYAQPRLVHRVPASAFSPRPKVDSAILQLRVRPQPAVDVTPERFFTVVRAGFSQKRKQLHNCLSAGLGLEKSAVQQWLTAAGVESTRRAETLTLEEWGAICRIAPAGGGAPP